MIDRKKLTEADPLTRRFNFLPPNDMDDDSEDEAYACAMFAVSVAKIRADEVVLKRDPVFLDAIMDVARDRDIDHISGHCRRTRCPMCGPLMHLIQMDRASIRAEALREAAQICLSRAGRSEHRENVDLEVENVVNCALENAADEILALIGKESA